MRELANERRRYRRLFVLLRREGERWGPTGFMEYFDGRMRDELLNETLFFELDDARAKIAAWVADYNIRRPHSSLKYLTPAAYAAYLTATDDRPRNPDQFRRSSVAPPALLGVQNPETQSPLDEVRGQLSGYQVPCLDCDAGEPEKHDVLHAIFAALLRAQVTVTATKTGAAA
jgi:putative transposase